MLNKADVYVIEKFMCMDSITFWNKYKILGQLSTHPSPNQHQH